VIDIFRYTFDFAMSMLYLSSHTLVPIFLLVFLAIP